MIVLVGSVGEAAELAQEVPPMTAELMRACWPGPLTVLLRANARRYPWLSAGSGKVGVRFPAHPFCTRLVAASKRPLLSTSANISGAPYLGDVAGLRALFARLAGTGPRCLVLLDDLVFDDAERTDRALRAALEGDAAGRPANVLVWATSNRLKLLRETLSEREDDVDEALGRGEKAALATRFGLRVAFPGLGQDEYLRVALGLLERLGGDAGDGAAAAALRFARSGHGMSPRTARQFAIDRVSAR